MGKMGRAASERRAGRERLMCPDCHLLPDPTHLPQWWCRVLFEIWKVSKQKSYIVSWLPAITWSYPSAQILFSNSIRKIYVCYCMLLYCIAFYNIVSASVVFVWCCAVWVLHSIQHSISISPAWNPQVRRAEVSHHHHPWHRLNYLIIIDWSSVIIIDHNIIFGQSKHFRQKYHQECQRCR